MSDRNPDLMLFVLNTTLNPEKNPIKLIVTVRVRNVGYNSSSSLID
ncbi:hypothetical protein [Nostoc sp.]